MNFNSLFGSVIISRISMIFVFVFFVFVEGHYVNYWATSNKVFHP